MGSQDFDLLALVESVGADLKREAFDRQTSIMSAIIPELPRSLHGDADTLKQAMTSMCRAAITATTGGHVYLEAGPAMANVGPSPGTEITFAVNYGSESKPSSEQLDQAMKLVSQLGSTLTWFTAAGRGARLMFSLELRLGNDRIPRLMLEEKLKHASVFIVSNEPAPNRALHMYLRFAGIHCNGAPTASETMVELGSRAAAESGYDLLIVASPIDDLPALEIARLIRSSEQFSNTRLLFVDDYELPGAAEHAMQAGFDAYLAKPVSQEEYLKTVTRLLGAPKAIDEVRAEASRQRTILIVEDNPVNQKTALFQLRRLGFQSDIASNGIEALEALEKNDYAIVLMDLQMPLMDGFQCAEEIRKQDRFKHLPIIALTANDTSENRKHCLDVGMNDFVAKPATLNVLRKVIESWIGQRSERE